MCLYENKKRTSKKGEKRRPGEMILLCDINKNIPIYHPYYLGVYQDESENEIFTKR